MSLFLQGLRLTVRRLLKNPALTLAVVLSLALGIGANTTIFTMVNAILLNPLPIEDSDDLVAVYTYNEEGGPFGSELPTSYPNFDDWVEQNEVFSHLVAYQTVPLAMVAGGEAEEVGGQVVSAGYFDMLKLRPAAGRFFLPEETRTPGTHPVTVLSHGLWKRRFAADPGTVGQTLTLNGHAFEIVGVAPSGFTGTGLLGAPDLWVPMMMHEQVLTGPFQAFFSVRRALMLESMARLNPGVTTDRAEAAMKTIASRLEQEYPNDNQGRSISLRPLIETTIPPFLRPQFDRAGTIMMVAVGLVLLIACANVANLLLARAEKRRSEIALRLSLGAGRGRLARQLLSEGVLLSLAGGAAGLALAFWGRGLLWGLRPPMLAQANPDLSFDTTVLGFTLAVSLLTGLLFGLVPALQSSSPDLAVVLRERAETTRAHRLWSPRNLLVIFQVAFSLIALVGSGLFLNSLRQAQKIDTGFETENLAVLAFNLGTQGYDPDRGLQFQRQILESASGTPGVSSAALATNRPLSFQFGGMMRTAIPQGLDATDPRSGTLVNTDIVSTGYFETLGIPILRGVDFTSGDRQGSRQVAIVNETMAGQVWPEQDALGQLFTFHGEDFEREVVGVARDSKYGTLGENPQAKVYVPLEQNYADQMQLFIHTAAHPGRTLGALQGTVRGLDGTLPLTAAATASQMLAESLWAPRLGALLLGIFGLLALVLAVIGIYGVMSYSVSLRNRELGIRMAIGAARTDVLMMVLRQGMKLVVIGVVVGWIGAALLFRWITSLLYGVSGTDPVTFTLAALVLVGIALLANLIPARRATAVDPRTVLKYE